jgi:GAF domain-containing protein
MSMASTRANPFKAILDVGTALVSSVVLEDALAMVAQKIGEAMVAWSVDIQRYDAERDVLVYEAYWCAGGVTADDLGYRGAVTKVWERPEWRKVLAAGRVVEQRIDDPGLAAEERAGMERWGAKTTLDAPLRVGDQLIGTIGIAETRFVRRFSRMEIDLFSQLCDMAASAINNARLFRRQEERNRHLQSLLGAGAVFTSTLDFDEVLSRVTAEAAEALGAAQASVYEYDSARDAIVYRARFDRTSASPSHDAMGSVYLLAEHPGDGTILRQHEVVIENVSDQELPADRRASMEAYAEKTCASVPLWFGDRPLGILRLYEFESERRYTPEEIELARGLGEQAAVAIQNARLYAELAEQERHLATLLEAAQAMTSSLAPADVFRSITGVAAGVVGSPRCAIYEFDDASAALTPRWVLDTRTSPDEAPDETGRPDDLAAYRGALLAGETVVEHASDALMDDVARDGLAGRGELTRVIVPLVFRGRPLGLLVLSETERERRFSGAELALVRGVGEAAAVALRNAQLAAALHGAAAVSTGEARHV